MYGIIQIIYRNNKASATVCKINIFSKPYSLMMQLDQRIMYLTWYFAAFSLFPSVVMNAVLVKVPSPYPVISLIRMKTVSHLVLCLLLD